MNTAKNTRFIKWTAIILVLTMALTFLIACTSDKKEEEPKPTPPPVEEEKLNKTDVMNAITRAIYASFTFDKSKPLGFEYSLVIPNTGKRSVVNFKGYLDTKTTNNARLYLDLVENNVKVFELSADDEFLYYTDNGNKRRIRNFKLGDTISGQNLPNGEEIRNSVVSFAVDLIFSLIFTGEDFSSEQDGDLTVNRITGSLSGIGELLEELLTSISPDIANKISTLLGGIDVELTAKVNKKGGIDNLMLSFVVDESYTNVEFTSKLDNYNPNIVTPAKADESYIESNVINFKIDGKVDMKTANNYTENLLTTYNYELAVDLDLFSMLSNAIVVGDKGISFDTTKLFSGDTGSIYFNLSHNCKDEAVSCNKIKPANGSIFTFAYAPRNFGNNDFYLSVNPLAILPKGFFESLGLPSLIEGMLGGQFGTNINPNVIFGVAPNVATMSDTANYAIPTDINIISVIGKVLNVIGDIRLNEADGLRIGIDSVINLVDELEPLFGAGDKNIPLIVKSFFGEADYMYIDVIAAEYGVPAIETVNYLEKFMIIDENVGEYKFSGNREGPAVSVEPIRDMDGNIAIFSSAVMNYEEIELDNGEIGYKPLPMSKAEYELMLKNPMSIKYNYTSITGNKGVGATFVNSISNFDTDKEGKQIVTVKTSFTDSQKDGTVGSLINLLIGLLHVDIKLDGNIFTTSFSVAEAPQVEFIQDESLGMAKFDPAKKYKYGDNLYSGFDIKLTYGNTVKVIKNYMPISGTENLASYSNKKNSKVQAVRDFELDYGIYGKKVVLVDNSNYKAPTDINVNIKTGEEYKLPNATVYFIDEAKKTITTNGNNVKFISDDNANIIKKMKKGLFGDVFDAYAVTFGMAGKHEVIIEYNNGVKIKYILNVEENVNLPMFNASIKGGKDKYNVIVGRENQLGDLSEIKVALKVEGKTVVGAEEVAEVRTLVFGEDYTITMNGVVLDKNELLLKAYQGIPTQFEITIINDELKSGSLKITYLALDYENAEIGGGAIKFE